MNVSPLLLPVASAAGELAVDTVRGAVDAAKSFGDLLSPATPDKQESATSHESEASSRVRDFQSLLRQLAATTARGVGKVSIDEIRFATEQQLSDWHQKVSDLLEGAGIDLAEPVALRIDSNGGILVSGDHPQKEAIEQFFVQQPELANDVRQLSAQLSLIAAAEAHQEFAAAYEEDPVAAVERWLARQDSDLAE